MAHVATPGMAVTYIRSTGEHVSATIIGPSTCGDDFFHVKYMRNGHELEHHAPMDRVLFPIRSPSPELSEPCPKRGRSTTRSESPPVRTSPAPAAPLRFGWELRTTVGGVPYYVDHNRELTTWERPELPAYSTITPKPPKARLHKDKRPVKARQYLTLDKFFKPTASSSSTASTTSTVATSSARSNSAAVAHLDCTPVGSKRRRSATEVRRTAAIYTVVFDLASWSGSGTATSPRSVRSPWQNIHLRRRA